MPIQDNPTPRAASKSASNPRRPESAPVSGLLVDVNVLQHCIDPVLHSLVEIGVRFGGGYSLACLATGVTEAATLLAAARTATKDTRGL
jgi:hypothetical protein